MVLPFRSTREASRGALTLPLAPIRVINPFSTSMAALKMAGLPFPGMSRAPSYNTTEFEDRDCGWIGPTEYVVVTIITAMTANLFWIMFLPRIVVLFSGTAGNQSRCLPFVGLHHESNSLHESLPLALLGR